MPTRAAVSAVSTASVQLTFWMFAVVFTCLLAAEAVIMIRFIDKESRTTDIDDGQPVDNNEY